MKKIIIPISTLFVVGLSHAQTTVPSTTENYVYTKTYITDPTAANPKTVETVQYFDGLGRPKQVVNVKASPTGKDVVTHIEYDGFGRQVKDYLPVPQSGTMNGAIVPTPLANATQTDIYGSEKIYAEKILENSPLDRIQQQIQVGNDWTNKPVKFDYDANVASDYVRKYETTTTWVEGRTQTAVQLLQYFQPSQLYKNTITDEDGNKTIEFKNGQGQTLLVRKVLSATENTDTYYVYNEYNQLAFVIPPLASAPSVEPSTVENLYYQYRYDGRKRLVEKKLPGKGWEQMIYNKRDQVIYYRDTNLKNGIVGFIQNEAWVFTKYDKFGRIVYTGICRDGNSRQNIQQSVDLQTVDYESRAGGFTMSGMNIEYGNVSYPTSLEKILSVNYYDIYPVGSPAIPSQILGQTVLPQDAQNSTISTKSFPTASYVKNIEDDNWTKNYTWYDTKGRPIGNHSINHLGGYTKTESELDFSGVPKQAITKHKRLDSDTEKVISETFTYDNQNRLKVHKHKIDNNPEEILAQNEYNELSQLKTKKVGGVTVGSGLQTVDYAYNIRGWMTKINDPNNLGNDLFGYKIKYNEVEGLQTPDASDTSLQVVPKFNGNIAEIDWKTSTQENEPLKTYGYVYDGLNRLSAGFYQNSSNPSRREYYEKVTYDPNGNIKTLKRTGASLGPVERVIDNLTYDYYPANASNRLQKITDASQNITGYPYKANPTDIGYDANGNMTSFQDKGISSIQYNYLNLPKQITQNSVVTNYTYRADGVKVKKLFGNVETHYLDGFQYKYTEPWEDMNGTMLNAEMKLRTIPTSEGYFDSLLNLYVYNYTDHLGNVRISYADSDHDGNIKGRDERIQECWGGNCLDYFIPGEVVDNNAYYPFGMLLENHNYYATNSNAYKYKYNGKELQETGMYDYGARQYMPDIGRWGVVDPLAETSRRWSTYTYAYNNPLRFIDPDGMENKDIHILGKLAQQGFDQLQASSKLSMEFDKESGNVTTANLSNEQYMNLSATDQVIYDGIKNENVDSRIHAENDNITPDGGLIPGGSFGGATYDKITGKVVVNQYVNPSVLGSAESFVGSPKGTGMLHEVVENALIGEKALKTQSSVPIDKQSNRSPMFQFAHDSAAMMMPQDNIIILARQNFDTVGMSVNRYWEGVAKKVDTNGKIQTKSLYKVDINNKRLRK